MFKKLMCSVFNANKYTPRQCNVLHSEFRSIAKGILEVHSDGEMGWCICKAIPT